MAFLNTRSLPNDSYIRYFSLREKNIIIFVFLAFVIVCFGGFFYLPGDVINVESVKVHIKRAGDDVFFPQGEFNRQVVPPHQREDDLRRLNEVMQGGNNNNDGGDGDQQNGNIPKPHNHIGIENNDVSLKKTTTAPLAAEVNSEENTQRRLKIVDMMKHAWSTYKKYAWGHNELKPISRAGHSASIFGRSMMGATIIDGMDTLHLMGLKEEFAQGREWIAKHLNFNEATEMSVFETNIRFVGGLLSCYAFTGDELFKNKAFEIATLLLPAFNTPTGIPKALIQIKTGSSRNFNWAWQGHSILSEFGTLHMEFAYLSNITGNNIFLHKMMKIREVISKIQTSDGLIPNYINPQNGKVGSGHVSIGALGDSFYEYLLKVWLLSDKKDTASKDLYDKIMKPLIDKMLKTSPKGNRYFTDLKNNRPDKKMGHLACFSGGMIALSSDYGPQPKDYYMSIAKDIGSTCRLSYTNTATKLGPESFHFDNNYEAKAITNNEKYYILRPEVIETYFYLWRYTKQQKYRDWAWDAVLALEKHCRTPNGYTGIKNVYLETPMGDDVQQSFFLAETLKYLFLIFSDDKTLDLDKWVLNTEAHPLPVGTVTFM